jgi:uncharacterized protein (DUF433 family)
MLTGTMGFETRIRPGSRIVGTPGAIGGQLRANGRRILAEMIVLYLQKSVSQFGIFVDFPSLLLSAIEGVADRAQQQGIAVQRPDRRICIA